MLTVYKASAGSGKTFRLVLEYLKLIIGNENNYRHILAVTFTNKATAEMKERVVSQLFSMAHHPAKSSYIEIISKELNMDKPDIQSRAKEALRNILHDYNRFSISTIDKFTQKVIKSFNRELGLNPGYILELDTEMLLQEATDRLLLKSSGDKELLDWLTQLGEERMRDDKGVNIRNEIFNLGKELFKENYQDSFFGESHKPYSRQKLKDYRKLLQKIIHSFETVMKDKGKMGLNQIQQSPFSIKDFSYGTGGVASVFGKVAELNFYFGSRILDGATDLEKWVSKSHKQRSEVLAFAETQLHPLLLEILAFYDSDFEKYLTAKHLSANLFTLGVLNDLQKEIDELRHEKGILPMSDSNLLLKKIINGSDSPFIYEKTGNWYHHFMLDEFQDTSGMQWENFRPLINNSLAEGKSNLAVGDVKQSIYRWRNSNWKILASDIETQFDSRQFRSENLTQNWRSGENIILFNNQLFPALVKETSGKLQKEFEDSSIAGGVGLIEKIYSDVAQTTGNPDAKNQGLVQVNFVEGAEPGDYKQQAMEILLSQIKELQDAGYSGNDIAILVRKNAEGSDIIRYFLDVAGKDENKNYNLEIISNESLFLSSSKSVTFVTQFINHLVNPGDVITKANILNEYNEYLRPALEKMGKDIVFKSVGKSGQVAFNFAETNASETVAQLGNNFEEEFDRLFSPMIKSLRTRILNASVDEVVTIICKQFNLFELEEDLPFLQGLIDQAAQVKSSLSNDLSNFLKWWEEKGYKLSVNVNDDTDAIRLLTIHKSKGLEFNAVLLPFVDWNLSWNYTPTLWCQPKSEPFNTLPLVPVRGIQDLKKTIFCADYLGEKLNSYVDNLNLLYVAFTRAVGALYMIAPFEPDVKTNRAVHHFLYDALKKLIESGEWEGAFDKKNQVFSMGKIPEKPLHKKAEKEKLVLDGHHYYEFSSRLKMRTDSEDFFPEEGLSDKNLGKILHEILSGIKTSGDIKKACDKELKLQKITQDEHKQLILWINELVDSVGKFKWFSGDFQIFNERSLLSAKGIKRPDRIMAKDKKAIVVDYKLGHAMPDAYNRQVLNYATELKNTGFEVVEGYLWYLIPNRIEKVC